MLGLTWRKSSRSGPAGHCVEARLAGETVEVRDSKAPDAGAVAFSGDTWSTFLAGVREGAFDLPA
jgi:hypothetical protein